jgi:indole-3-glycerol phosphate synthase
MYLDKIVTHKREEIKTMERIDTERSRPMLDPLGYLSEKPFIAEIKKASPSRGVINTNADITARAISYEKGGAGAVSVLTDARFFQGSYGHLSDISRAVKVPLLCKDFIISEVQIDNAYLCGSDFILLIAAILSAGELRLLTKRATHYSMKVLYELHDRDEFDKIRDLDPELVGINSRDLKSFKINKQSAMNTIASLPAGFLKVAESGIETADDVRDFARAGADAFLIGTSLMTSEDPAHTLRGFYGALERPCS